METTITCAARQIGIKQGSLSNILNGKRGASPALALRLSKKTKTSLEIWLFKSRENLELRKQAVKNLQPSFSES